MNLMIKCAIIVATFTSIVITSTGICSAESSSSATASVETLPSPASLLKGNSGHLLHSYPDSTGSLGVWNGNNIHHLSPFSSSSSSSSSLIRSGAVLKETFVSRVVDPGTSISLKCTAYGNPLPQVTWTLDGGSLHESTPRLSVGDFVTKSSEVISYVNITNAGVEDGGLYACMAANEVTSAIHSGRIDISGDPFIRAIKDKIAIEGSPLLLTCPYAGHPIDEVYWEHNNRRLPYNHRQRSFTNGSVMIDVVDKRSDSGEYKCVVKSAHKVASKMTKVIVESPPVIHPFSFSGFLEEGNRAKIFCSVIKGDPPITIRWLKDGRPLTSSPLTGISVSTLDEFSSAIVISKLSLGHRGNYTCIASNAASSSNFTATAVVYAHPRWTLEPSNTVAVTGKDAMIHCQSEGFPDPLIEWRRSLTPKSLSSSFAPISLDGRIHKLDNGTLEIKHVDKSDEGYYMCKSSNGLGAGISTVVTLTVRTPAHFKEEFRVETVTKSSQLTVKCEALGDKPLSINWKKDGQPFLPSSGNSNSNSNNNISPQDKRYILTESMTESGLSSIVRVDSADRRDSSLYTCSASNAYGSDEINVQVIVQERPDAPSKASISRVEARTISVTWSPPYSGNSPLLYYLIEWKEVTDDWGIHSKSQRVPGTETRASISGLWPGTAYNVRLFAENSLGRSEPGPIMHAITELEAPSEPPSEVTADALGSKAIRVSWKPGYSLRMGSAKYLSQVKGYYVGFKLAHSVSSVFNYKTVEVTSLTNNTSNGHNGNSMNNINGNSNNINFNSSPGQYEAVIGNLEKLTKYVIIVKAFNRKGTGPPSDEIYVKTNDLDIPNSPELELVSAAHKSIEIKWEITGTKSLSGFTIFIREESASWREIPVSSDSRFYQLRDLLCGTKYQIYVSAHNEAGSGLPSNTIATRTHGTVPIAPSQGTFLKSLASGSGILLHLSEWQSGGCSIKYFMIHMRSDSPVNPSAGILAVANSVVGTGQGGNSLAMSPNSASANGGSSRYSEWQSLADPIAGDQQKYIIKDLLPETWYRMRVAAHNDAGTTEAEYAFTTSSTGGTSNLHMNDLGSGAIGTSIGSNGPSGGNSDDSPILGVLIMPILATVTISACIAAAIVSVKRKSHLHRHDTDGNCSMKESMAYSEALPMSEVSSVKAIHQMHQANHQVHSVGGSSSCSASRNNLYDKSLNSTPKECLYFSSSTPATAISSSSTDHLHHHQHHHLHHQLQLHHHPYQTPSKADQMAFQLQQQMDPNGVSSGPNIADIYVATSPLHPGQFRVAAATRDCSASASHSANRNYEVPFVLSTSSTTASANAKTSNGLSVSSVAVGSGGGGNSSQVTGSRGYLGTDATYSFPSRRRNSENTEGERGAGNLHVRLMWDESESGCSPAASSDVTTTTTGNEEYSSVQAVYGSVPSIRNLDETPMDNWTVGGQTHKSLTSQFVDGKSTGLLFYSSSNGDDDEQQQQHSIHPSHQQDSSHN